MRVAVSEDESIARTEARLAGELWCPLTRPQLTALVRIYKAQKGTSRGTYIANVFVRYDVARELVRKNLATPLSQNNGASYVRLTDQGRLRARLYKAEGD